MRFEVTKDVSQYTKAAVFQPGVKTDMLVRFSTVAGERGSPDTWRDPRGFALKFYTSQGNYDMVGNNTPVFFVRDPMKFQHFIRSQKRRADTNLRDHDMQWDFWTLSPESAHQVTYLMGDRGIPKSWRHMNGYSSHTYMWANAKGQKFWVKYHFKTDQGVDFLTQAEADRLAGADGDYHTRDLYQAIARGEHPSWTLQMQVMPFDEAKTYRFNPFDLTKVWPHSDYPLIEVGRMTLDRNPTDYHTEIEQAAFEPNNLVPGIGPSPDKMLLARLFSYTDAHRARMGVNYKQIPVNRPKAPVHSYSKDGAMRVENVSDPVYAPNSKGGPKADPAAYPQVEVWEASGEFIHAAYTKRKDDDDFGQPGALVRKVMDNAQRDRLVSNVVGHLKDGVTEPCWRARSSIGGKSTRQSAIVSPKASRENASPRNSAEGASRVRRRRPSFFNSGLDDSGGSRNLNVIHFREVAWIGQHSHLCERAIVEHVGDGVAGFDHDQPDRAGFQIGAVVAWAKGGDRSAGDRRKRAIQRPDDRAHSDLVRRTSQRVSTAFPLLGIDEAGTAQLGQNMIEKLLRDRIGLGDVGGLGKHVGLEARQVHHCLEAIFSFVGQHGSSSARPASLCGRPRDTVGGEHEKSSRPIKLT